MALNNELEIPRDRLKEHGRDRAALKFIRAFFDQGKVVAAVCHAPWLLIETNILKGRRAISYKSIKTDMILDQGVVTSRNPR
jgi:protease I